MSQCVAILGRQPALGIAELESLFGADKVRPVGNQVASLDVDPCGLPFDRLGGAVKLGKILSIFDTTNWQQLEKLLLPIIPDHIQKAPEGKFRLGISAYGLSASPSKINATALSFKKVMKQYRNVRVIPNNSTELSSAQVLHNKLTDPTAWELLFIRDGNKTILAQTIFVQDINAYADRDQARPKRDARVGMLPPKLAQIIINLAGKHVDASENKALASNNPTSRAIVLDPFCGTGVILQEAALMGYDTYGTDLEPRMIEYTKINLDWLGQNDQSKLEVADATSARWDKFDLIACETYLGRPFSADPKPEVLEQVMQDVNTIHEKFLNNLARQTESGFRACIAVPAWKTKSGFKHLKVLDHLEKIGYTRQSFVHVSNSDLIYHRPEQIVGRELVVITRK